MAVKIEKLRKKAELTLLDGTSLAGNFFLHDHSPVRDGAETVLDVLNGKKSFIPFEVADGVTVLVNKESVAVAKLEEREAERDETYTDKHRVIVSLLSDDTLEGVIFVDLPEERSRISDFFNHYTGFFCLEVGGNDCLVNLEFVKTVRPIR